VGLLLVAAAACGDGGDDACTFGGGKRCEEHSGPLEVSFCQLDGTWSECTKAALCNPLTQEGCDAGLACYSVSYSRTCLPPESYPCEPGEVIGDDGDGDDCVTLCTYVGSGDPTSDAPECRAGEVCIPLTRLPEGVGLCGPPPSDDGG
jgi:hypothetical protein